MTSVSETLHFALPAGAQGAYPREYNAVLEALTERDYALTDTITEAVVQHFNVPAAQVRDQLAYIGMAVRPPAPVPAPVNDLAEWEKALLAPDEPAPATVKAPAAKAKKGKKNGLKKQVKALVKAARRNGINI
jgi:hypothetical protein